MRRALLPILLTVGGLGVGYTIYRRMTVPPPSLLAPAPGVQPPSEGEAGVSYQAGGFDVFVPFEGVGNFIKGLFDGGTKDKTTEEVEPTDPSVGLKITPYAPADYGIANTPAYGPYSGLGIGSR